MLSFNVVSLLIVINIPMTSKSSLIIDFRLSNSMFANSSKVFLSKLSNNVIYLPLSHISYKIELNDLSIYGDTFQSWKNVDGLIISASVLFFSNT